MPQLVTNAALAFRELAGPLMRATVDTASLPSQDRFDFWQDMLNQQVMPVKARSAARADFTGTLQATDHGAIKIVFTTSRSVDVERTPALIRRDDPETFLLILNFHGRHRMLQDRKDGLMEPGGMVLLHSSRAFHSKADLRQPYQVGSVVILDPAVLPFPAHRLSTLVATPFSASDSVVKLVARYLYGLGSGTFDPIDAGRLSAVAVDLVSLMLARRLRLEDNLTGQTRSSALFARVQAYITAHLGDPGLNLADIAAAHHLSLRSLHRLFQAHEETAAGWIRARRLQRCRRDLLDPAHATRSVRAIGARWGFPDPAHFTRVFKSVYGCTPATFRAEKPEA